MIWMIIESPKHAFKKIILAEHKNFVLLIALFSGIGIFFVLMWSKKSGNNYDNLLPLLFHGTVLGVIISLPFFFALTTSIYLCAKIVFGKGSWKETYGIIGWSLVPIMISVVFVLPIELASLGLYIFSTSPSGYEVKPSVYLILTGMDGICVAWSILLGAIGISMVHRIKFIVSLCIVSTVAVGIFYLSVIIYSSFNI
ncbi:MAG: YIP1 family protein [Bacteroidota bacterium]|nr:YIP1 family protein [Bacteroidota bacterium]